MPETGRKDRGFSVIVTQSTTTEDHGRVNATPCGSGEVRWPKLLGRRKGAWLHTAAIRAFEDRRSFLGPAH